MGRAVIPASIGSDATDQRRRKPAARSRASQIHTKEPIIPTIIILAAAALALQPATANPANPAAADPTLEPPQPSFENERRRQVAAIQILLDRGRHSPGVIDGLMGENTRRAILSYQRDHGFEPTGEPSATLLLHLRSGHGTQLFQRYSISEEDVAGPFHDVPSSMAGKAELDRTAYESAAEGLAEKFHLSLDFLRQLNPHADFGRAGTTIVVPRPADQGLPVEVARVEVDKASNELRAYTADGKLAATYPVTVGSNIHPSPNDKLEVLAVAPDPTYHFDPAGRSWGPDRSLTIAPGPNNPVGTVWIDLSRDGYGIHGTPEPRLIGKTESHGCVRLTNWDAEELADAVRKGTIVEFV